MKTALFAILFSFQILANAVPDNFLANSVSNKVISSITENDFRSVTNVLHRIYSPIIKEASGLNFVIDADWKDSTVNAYATREVESWTVHVAGGIARATGMTKDSLALVVCHEIGHHLGGAPKTFLYSGWPSAEGQADYWATSKCLKKYYDELKNEAISVVSFIPEKVLRDCARVYKNDVDLKICVRTMLASISFSHFLNTFPDVKVPTSIEEHDPRQVKGTNTNDYPRPQCRLDTLYAGALCNIQSDIATSQTDVKIGHCNDMTKPGTRPRCWYRP